MPAPQESRPPTVRPVSDSRLKAACSVSELAQRCGLSRSRWYELVNSGVMPHPVYCITTRRPFYPRELQETAINLRMTNTSLDGRFVLFYNRRETASSASATRPSRSNRSAGAPPVPDGKVTEVIGSLRMLGIEHSDTEIKAAISHCYPSGLPEDLEMGLTTVFRHLRRLDRAR